MCGPGIRRLWTLVTSFSLVFFATLSAATAWAQPVAPAGVSDPSVSERIDAWVAENAAFLSGEFLGSAWWRYVATFLTIGFFFGLRRFLSSVLLGWLKKLTAKTENEVDNRLLDAFAGPLQFAVSILGVYLAITWLVLPGWFEGFASAVFRIAFILTVSWAALSSVGVFSDMLDDLAGHTKSKLDDYLVPLVGRVARVVVIGLTVVFVLEELGFNVAGILAGLGVGGLALALAAQDTMANWFGALMIYTDRPFAAGDWVKTPSIEGVVEEIGLRSTKIRTFSKTLVSVPNRELAQTHVENFSLRPIRRVNMSLGLTYDTTPAMMRESLARLRDVLRNHEGVDQSFWLVKFTGFGDSSLTIMLYYFTNTTNWDTYLSIREEIHLQIMDTLAEIGVEMAFPSTSVYMSSPDKTRLAELDAKAEELYKNRVFVHHEKENLTAPSSESADG